MMCSRQELVRITKLVDWIPKQCFLPVLQLLFLFSWFHCTWAFSRILLWTSCSPVYRHLLSQGSTWRSWSEHIYLFLSYLLWNILNIYNDRENCAMPLPPPGTSILVPKPPIYGHSCFICTTPFFMLPPDYFKVNLRNHINLQIFQYLFLKYKDSFTKALTTKY